MEITTQTNYQIFFMSRQFKYIQNISPPSFASDDSYYRNGHPLMSNVPGFLNFTYPHKRNFCRVSEMIILPHNKTDLLKLDFGLTFRG